MPSRCVRGISLFVYIAKVLRTTFVDANHTVAYVAVRILNFNCCSAATVHLNDLLLVLLRVARATWMSSDSLGRVVPCVRACNGSPTT